MEETNLYFLLLLLLLPLLYLIFNQINSPRNLPPGPYPWPIVGNLLNLGNKPHISLANLAATYGPLMSLRLGTKLLVVGSSPSAATEILRNYDQIFSARSIPRAVPACPDRLHLSMGWMDCTDRWRYLRTLCHTELFSSKAIQSQARIRDSKVTDLVEFLHTKEGREVKIAEVVFVTVFNMLSSIFMSKDFISFQEGEENGLRASVRKFMQVLSNPNLADYYTILSGLDLQSQNKRAKEIFDESSQIWEDVIQERRANKDGTVALRERDFLDGLIVSGFSNEEINYLFLELFFAGADTTTSTVEWALAELMKHPEAMSKVRYELETCKSEKIPKESDLPNLPYLLSVVKETLRLHPPAPLLLPHRASKTCNVMNYTIPKDTQVYVNVWAIGRDPRVWDDSVTFKPERFLDMCTDFNSNNHAYIPFGAGRRICPGLPMAAKQVPLILAGLIQSFEWHLPHNENPTELGMEEKFGVISQKEKPLVLVPKVW